MEPTLYMSKKIANWLHIIGLQNDQKYFLMNSPSSIIIRYNSIAFQSVSVISGPKWAKAMLLQTIALHLLINQAIVGIVPVYFARVHQKHFCDKYIIL